MPKRIKLIEAIIKQLESYSNPDEVIFFRGNVAYTPKKLIEHIKDLDETGLMLLEEVLKTATDMFIRGKK